MEKTAVLKCSHCEKTFAGLCYRDGKGYCANCFDLLFMHCSYCGLIVSRDDIYHFGRHSFCPTCLELNTFRCSRCEELVLNENIYMNRSGERYCGVCYEETHTSCARCDNEIYIDDAYSIDDGRYLCSHCYEQEGSRLVHDCGYRPRWSFNKQKWENTLYLGIELEVETRDFEDSSEDFTNYTKRAGLGDLFYLKEDGSLNNGFEIVSHPFTLQYAHKNFNFRKMLAHLLRSGNSSYKQGTCGFHIHLDRRFFTNLEVKKMRLFFSYNRTILRKFSNRGNTGGSYCLYERYDKVDFLDNKQQAGRYNALNINTGKNTIEIRIFRGTLDFKRFLASLQFTDAVANYVKEVSAIKLMGFSWPHFIEWALHKGRYNHFVNYIIGKERLCV